MEWWQKEFKDNYYRLYHDQFPPERTNLEVDFLCKQTPITASSKIFDLACGQGRHLKEFARRGYHNLAGLDYSDELLSIAHRNTPPGIQLMQGDMRELHTNSAYDLIYCIFTAFGYFNSDNDNQLVLQNVARSLKDGGYFVLDLLNPLNKINQLTYKQENILEKSSEFTVDEKQYTAHETLDLLTMRWENTIVSKNSKVVEFHSNARLYTLVEIANGIAQAGLKYTDAYGGFHGEPYTPESKRLIVVSKK